MRVTIQMKAIEQYFHVVLFVFPYLGNAILDIYFFNFELWYYINTLSLVIALQVFSSVEKWWNKKTHDMEHNKKSTTFLLDSIGVKSPLFRAHVETKTFYGALMS